MTRAKPIQKADNYATEWKYGNRTRKKCGEMEREGERERAGETEMKKKHVATFISFMK